MEKYKLELYISGKGKNSDETITTIKSICKQELQGNYDVEIIDILEKPDRAELAQIMAIPTLIKKYPLPESRLIGALVFKTSVFAGLGILTD